MCVFPFYVIYVTMWFKKRELSCGNIKPHSSIVFS